MQYVSPLGWVYFLEDQSKSYVIEPKFGQQQNKPERPIDEIYCGDEIRGYLI